MAEIGKGGDRGKRKQAHDLLAPVYGWFTEGLIRHLLFLTYIIGVFVAIDATFFAGQYRTAALTVSWPAVWQDVTYRGWAFNLEVERWLRKSLW